MPGFPIVDSHVHLYDPKWLRYGWLSRLPQIEKRHDLEDFDRARREVEVERLVFVEVGIDPGLHLAEAGWVQGLADGDRRVAGIVAHAPVEKGAGVEEDLARLAENPALRGIRRLLEIEVDQHLALDADFIAGVQAVGRRGLIFDLCVKHWGLFAAIELARRCPEVTFVLDHIGKPPIRLGLEQPWRSQLERLAELPNVTCKVSGVITEADHQAWTPAQVRPFIEHAIACFGFDRVMYGSDWPVSALTHAYPDWVGLLDQVLAGTSEGELRRFWRDNAMRTYRLDG